MSNLDIKNAKAIIGKKKNLIVALIFDNTRVFTVDPSMEFDEQVELDESTNSFIFHKKSAGVTMNNNPVMIDHIEDVDSLQAIDCVTKPEDRARYLKNDY